jgi:rhodanese-related sulfurtransferase
MTEKINLKQIITNGALVIDVRTKDEYNDGHLKGSLSIPLDELEKNMSWLIKDVPIIIVCASGSRSAQAKDILETNGFEKVYNGGSWNNLGEFHIGGCPV